MGWDWKKFGQIVSAIAPIALTLVNPALAPIAGTISHAINEAENIPNATGAEKSQHVKNIVNDAVITANVAGANVDAVAVDESLQEGIDTVIAVTKVFNK